MHANYVALTIVAVYIIGLGIVTSIIQRSVKTANVFTSGTTGKTGVPAVLVGMMLMSEFIGTSASVGTAQEAYKFGISAAWNIIALAAGFVFYGFFLAGRYKSSGHNTISAILNDVYGRPTKLATSLVMIFALEIVAVAIYAGGGTILSALLGIHKTLAIVICGVVSVLYVFMGGMKSEVYTNIVHSVAKYVGICVALYFGLTHVGGWSELHAKLPPEMFSLHNVGFGKIFAWFIAGMGATFSTQYVIQAINTTDSPRSAKLASFSTAKYLDQIAFICALVGMCSLVLYPNVLSMTYLGKAVRASLSVLVLLVFFAPMFGSRIGAFVIIIASLIATVGWFMLGNPFGIHNAYIALIVPLLVMAISHVFKGATDTTAAVPSTGGSASGNG